MKSNKENNIILKSFQFKYYLFISFSLFIICFILFTFLFFENIEIWKSIYILCILIVSVILFIILINIFKIIKYKNTFHYTKLKVIDYSINNNSKLSKQIELKCLGIKGYSINIDINKMMLLNVKRLIGKELIFAKSKNYNKVCIINSCCNN